MATSLQELDTRFWAKVKIPSPNACWSWVGCTVHNGYGQFNLGVSYECVRVYAHRYAYEAIIGEIPDGFDLDHLCRNRSCVNPSHLEPVTRQENLRRGINGDRTHCNQGHEYTEENTYYNPSGFRVCRICKRRWRLGKGE